MLFQYYPYYGSSGIFQSLVQTLLNWGLMDAILPFVLIFTILYFVILQVPVFNKKKGVAVIIALSLSAMVLIPHILHIYPPAQDPFIIMGSVLPSLTIIILGIFMLMILLGFTGTQLGSSRLISWVGTLSVIALIYIILANIFPSFQLTSLWWFFGDPSVMAFIIIVAVMGLIILFVTSDSNNPLDPITGFVNSLRGLFGGGTGGNPPAAGSPPGGAPNR